MPVSFNQCVYRAGLYDLPTVCAFFRASIPWAPLISGVVFQALIAPPAETAIATPAALSMLGRSKINTASYSPRHNHPPTNVPPTASAAARATVSTRFCGFATCEAQDSDVYASWLKKSAILSSPSHAPQNDKIPRLCAD